MNPDWMELNVFCDLSHLGLLAVRGADAASFLQGQLTCDVREVCQQRSLLGAHCSPKGRILTLFRLFCRDDALFIRLPIESLEATLKRLRMYVLRAKVQIEDASHGLDRIGIAGPAAEAQLQKTFGSIPAKINDVVQLDDITLIRVPGIQPRFEMYGQAFRLKAVSNNWPMNESARAVWEFLDIVAGIPTIYPQTADAFLPQMVNLQLLDGVSFRKGCYPGQEIIARTQHLGKLKRRMYRAHISADLSPKPGDELFTQHLGSSENAGRIVAAAPHPKGGHEVLAVVLIACAEGAAIRLGDAQGPLLDFKPLPYPFEDMPG